MSDESLHNAEEAQDLNQERMITVTGMYKDWFLDYASYVILERAVPAIEDGFKPVQRRIMHALKELDDGRYNKVANVVGHTMQYHPHGDASISDAMVQMGQKDLLIDTQGNWGNILTGDSAAASRYIEARLSKFALEVVFSPKVTEWQMSYDGRKKEPVNLPVKFPMLLAQGAEGIAVGLSTKILPHNFNELIDASVAYLNNRSFTLVPDFPTGGLIDVENYNNGLRGGRIRVRAKIDIQDKNTLVVREIPFGTNTSSLIESILKANEKGKIKIKKIEDNTAEHVEILIHLPSGISPDKTLDALYAFTGCEQSIAPLACVIEDNKPAFLDVKTILKRSTDRTVALLKAELNIQLQELEEQWHFASLERIFIENRIYRDIEEEETWEGVLAAISKGLAPHVKNLKRAVTEQDIEKLTEIRIKRISKFDIDKAAALIESLEGDILEVKNHLDNIVDYAIQHFKALKKKYGEGRERKSEIRVFDAIEATKVVIRNLKLYMNREEGFIGTGLKKDEYVAECSDIDDVIVFLQNGTMMVTKVDAKVFVGKDILYAGVFKKNDQRMVYNMIYKLPKGGPSYIKRFNVTSITRDKSYSLVGDVEGASVLYFSANPNGEAEVVTVLLRQTGSVKKLKWDIDFSDILIKGRASKGNIVSKYPVKRVEFKSPGKSTLKPRSIWFDDVTLRLNTDKRGRYLGDFTSNDLLLIATEDGLVKTVIPDLSLHIAENTVLIEKWVPKKPLSVIHFDPERDRYYIKRFLIEQEEKEESVLTDTKGATLMAILSDYRPSIKIEFVKPRGKDELPPLEVDVADFIAVKGIKAIGNQLTAHKIKQIVVNEPLPYEEEIQETKNEGESEDDVEESENGDLRLF